MVMSMPVKFEVSVVQVGNSLKITIPKQLAKHLELEKGSKVSLHANNRHIIVEKNK